MNFLAHALLSFDEPATLAGNLWSDFIKGKKKFDYPLPVQKGIALHRAIDEFTDNHRETKFSKSIFRDDYRLYSGPFVDVVYDHFLARDFTNYHHLSLADFASYVYSTIEDFIHIGPVEFGLLLPYMRKENWLLNYNSLSGIRKSFNGVVRRATYLSESETAFDLLTGNYDALEASFRRFMPELLQYVNDWNAEHSPKF
jgi:acyl carrier protein phosphodiesterase